MRTISKGNDDYILRPREVAEMLNVHTTTVWRWRRNGEFPEPIRLGPRICGWRRSTVDAWLDRQIEASASAPAGERH